MKEQKTSAVPGWLELYDLSTHRDVEALGPRGYHIRGMLGGRATFEPTSEILGEALAQPPENAIPGWLELMTLTTHRDMEAVAPVKPYVHGVLDDAGHFYPDEPPSIQGRIATD